MSQIANSMRHRARTADEDPAVLEQRLFRNTGIVVAVAVVLSAGVAPWRITSGLLLGGVLSLLNNHWLRTALAAAFAPDLAGTRPKIRVARYVLRYFIVGAIVVAAHLLNLVSLPATLLGMCSFAAALVLEGLLQIYFVIMNRGDE